jgi:hypothetical protein
VNVLEGLNIDIKKSAQVAAVMTTLVDNIRDLRNTADPSDVGYYCFSLM